MNDPTRYDRLLAVLGGLVIGAVYLATAGRYVLGGDNGEFASIFATGGVAHPSGYPLYSVYLRLVSWLPGESVAHSAALGTALLGTGAFFSIRWSARNWGASAASATIAAALVGVSPLMWKMSTHAEVFALHALLGSSIAALAGPYCGLRSGRRVFALGLLAGFGLCNNHSIVTMAPLGLYAVGRAVWTARSRPRMMATGAAGLALGLSPYLYTFLSGRATDGRIAWGETGTFRGVLHHFLRADYGTTNLAISDSGTNAVEHIGRLLFHLASELHFAPLVLVVVGLASMARGRVPPPPEAPRTAGESAEALLLPLHRRTVRDGRRPERTSSALVALPVPRALAWAYLATLLLAGPLFIARFNLPLQSLALLVVERFYLLPLVLLVVPLAVGIDRLLGDLLSTIDIQGPALVMTMCLGVFLGYDGVREHNRPDVEYYLTNTLRTVERDSVILGTGDHRLYGLWYVQRVGGMRTDVVYIDPILLSYPWYRERVEVELGFSLGGVSPGAVDSREVAESVLAAGRSLYLANRFSEAITEAFPSYPIGTLIRVVRRGDPLPSPDQLETMNVEVAIRYQYAETDPLDPNGWSAYVQADYIRPWQVLADAYESRGRHADAERCRNRRIIFPQGPL